MMCKQHDTTLREVLAHAEPVDSVRLLTWFFSTTDNLGAAPAYFMDEVFATAVQLRVEGLLATPLQAQELPCLSVCSLSCAYKQPSTSGLYSTSSGSSHVWHQGFWNSSQFLFPCTSCQHQTQEAWSFPNSASDDKCNKRAHIRIEKEPINNGSYGSNVNAGSAPLITKHDKQYSAHKHSNVNRGHSLQLAQPRSSNGAKPKTRSSKTALAASHSPDQPKPESIDSLQSSQGKCHLWQCCGCGGL